MFEFTSYGYKLKKPKYTPNRRTPNGYRPKKNLDYIPSKRPSPPNGSGDVAQSSSYNDLDEINKKLDNIEALMNKLIEMVTDENTENKIQKIVDPETGETKFI